MAAKVVSGVRTTDRTASAAAFRPETVFDAPPVVKVTLFCVACTLSSHSSMIGMQPLLRSPLASTKASIVAPALGSRPTSPKRILPSTVEKLARSSPLGFVLVERLGSSPDATSGLFVVASLEPGGGEPLSAGAAVMDGPALYWFVAPVGAA